MISENEKYEYMLHTWGGFYNKEYQVIHGLKDGYFFFDTAEARELYLKGLYKIRDKINEFCCCLATTQEEGTHVRYKTIAKMKLVYKGNLYDYEEDFGFAYPADSARYMFMEGNYSCDCNKSGFLISKYGSEIEELECGHAIEIREFEILQIKSIP